MNTVRRIIFLACVIGVLSAAAVEKRSDERYGGAGTVPIAPPSYSPIAAPSNGAGGVSGAAAAPSYSGTGTAADNGNLYYYYYPVTNMQQQPGAGNQGYNVPAYPSYPVQPTTSNPLFDFFGFGNIDFNSLIIPLLLLGGVLLLLPAILGCDLQSAVCTIPLPTGGIFGRRRREVDGNDGPVTLQENIERAYDIYMTAMEGDMCLKRISCEMGVTLGKLKGQTAFLGLLDAVVPDQMRDSVKAFKTGATTDKTKCQLYKCGSKRWSTE